MEKIVNIGPGAVHKQPTGAFRFKEMPENRVILQQLHICQSATKFIGMPIRPWGEWITVPKVGESEPDRIELNVTKQS